MAGTPAKFEVLLTEGAEQDLEAIHDDISEFDSVANANYELDALIDVVESLSRFPERGSYPKELVSFGIREYRQTFFKPYRVIYRGQFSARYGFLEKPTRIRFRVLDSGIRVIPRSANRDVALDADSFSRLQLSAQRVFITENENYSLAFPQVRHDIVIFGAGYGWEALPCSNWRMNCSMHYWGNIDTHGFGILDQLRGSFEHVASFLMDKKTLDAHTVVWGKEEKPLVADLHRLTPEERNLYDDLRDNRIRPGLRLEQEHIGFNWVADRLRHLVAHDASQQVDGSRARPTS